MASLTITPSTSTSGRHFVPSAIECRFDNRIACEGRNLLSEVVPFNSDTLALQPLQISCKPRQDRVDTGSTNSCGAAHGGVKYLDFYHGIFLITIFA